MVNILFRADAAPNIGVGDLMSLINLSRYFGGDCKCYFMVKDYVASINLVEKHDIENLFIIKQKDSLRSEVNSINSIIRDYGIDVLFLQITSTKLSNYVGIDDNVKKVAINFDGHILDDLDLVINWDVEARKLFDVERYPSTKFLLGPEYVILPKEFYSMPRLMKKISNEESKILVAMGGGDELDLTSKIVTSIINLDLNFYVNVVVGSGYKNIDKLERMLKNAPIGNDLKYNITNMLDQYLDCDIGIGAGGLTSSEMVASGISPILIAAADHQVARCKYFHRKGWASYIGFKEYEDEDLNEAILNPVDNSMSADFRTAEIVESVYEIL